MGAAVARDRARAAPPHQPRLFLITHEMKVAGASALWELEAQMSKEALARQGYLAMASLAVRGQSC